jgi:hypothetical protein
MSNLHFVEVAAVAFSITESQTGTSETFTVTCGGIQLNCPVMISRRRSLALMVASVILPGAHATPVKAAAIGSNMRKFVAREAVKQKKKREDKEGRGREEVSRIDPVSAPHRYRIAKQPSNGSEQIVGS